MYQAEYSTFNEYNRFENLDGIESKVLFHLVNSQTKHAQNMWRLLKYETLDALAQDNVPVKERLKLVSSDNGYPTDKRVFLAPFIDDAWEVQCSSIYVFVDGIKPVDGMRAIVTLTVEIITHSKVSTINGDGDPISNPDVDVDADGAVDTYGANPNDSDEQGSIVVLMKNRETVLLKSILAELNGLYLDGIGYLVFDKIEKETGEVTMPLFNGRPFYGHKVKFLMEVSGVSDSGGIGY